MRKANPEIISLIKEKALELLMKQNPDTIGMRDIARECGITAASIYYYYSDKDALFQQIALDCLRSLNESLVAASQTTRNPKKKIIRTIDAYRRWCFQNPRKALLVMQGIKSASDAPPETVREYYVCNRTGIALLEECVSLGIARSENPALDVGILVNGLWGCIESVLLKKCDVEYWGDGDAYADRFIKMWMKSIFVKRKEKPSEKQSAIDK